MSVSPVCPRCGETLVVRPGSSAQAWCHVHGAVTPLHHTVLVAHNAISAVTADARVPAWVPDPIPAGWSVTGLAWGGGPRLSRPAAGAAERAPPAGKVTGTHGALFMIGASPMGRLGPVLPMGRSS